MIIVHDIVRPAASSDGSATATVRCQLLEPPGLQIPLSAIWIDLIEPTVEEDRKVQEFVGVPVPTKADPDYTEPPRRIIRRTACATCMRSSSANQRTRPT